MEHTESGGLVLPRGLFTGEAVEEFVVFNKDEVEATAESEKPVKPRGAWFKLQLVTGDLDAEYTKKRGQDTHSMTLRPMSAGGKSRVHFDGMEVSFSNERELAAMSWLFKKVCVGWRGISLDDSTELAYSEENRDKMSKVPQFVKPILDAAYALGNIKDQVLEGNS